MFVVDSGHSNALIETNSLVYESNGNVSVKLIVYYLRI